MGIRPEHFKEVDSKDKEEYNSSFKCNVEVKEMMGSETYLYTNICDTQVVARVKASTSSNVGENVELLVKGNKIHLFDIDTEKTIF